MNKDYIKELEIIVQKTKHDIRNYYDGVPGEELVDDEICKSLGKLLEQLDSTRSIINHYLTNINEGHLVLENVSSNYVIKFTNDDSFQPLSIGAYLEVYKNGKGWNVVKVEHRMEKGYYFYSPLIGYPKLYPNMKVMVKYRY